MTNYPMHEVSEALLGEVLVYYDGPQLMVLQNQEGMKLLALYISEEDDMWLYVAATDERIEALKRGDIDLRSAIVDHENLLGNMVAMVYVGENRCVHEVVPEALGNDYLPDEGFFLD